MSVVENRLLRLRKKLKREHVRSAVFAMTSKPWVAEETSNQNKNLRTKLSTGSVYMTSEEDGAALPSFTSKPDRFWEPRK
jgi:hypothetical protein